MSEEPEAAPDLDTIEDVVEARSAAPDLDAIEAELDGVERALQRLADDTYWTDEVTGAPIPDEVLAADPIARRVADHAGS